MRELKFNPDWQNSWDVEPGAKERVFKLRKNVSFHNGKPLTADDVVYSLNHHRAPDSKSALRGMMSTISDIKATDKNEVTITLGSGNADLPALLSDWHLGIGPNELEV